MVFGVGYISSALLRAETALLLSAITTLLTGLGTDAKGAQKNVPWSRWTAEALWVSEARPDLWSPEVQNVISLWAKQAYNFELGTVQRDLAIVVLYIVLFRLWAWHRLVQNAKARN